MSQLMFDVDTDNEVYLNHLCPNPNLVDDSTPLPAELLWHYTKLFDTLIILRLKISHDKTLSTLRHSGQLVDIKLADVSATDLMLDIDDTKFTDWCKHNQFAWLWNCPNFNKSALLQLAIETCIKNLPIISMQHNYNYSTLNQSFLDFLLLKLMAA
jgi:hypothetical protein